MFYINTHIVILINYINPQLNYIINNKNLSGYRNYNFMNLPKIFSKMSISFFHIILPAFSALRALFIALN